MLEYMNYIETDTSKLKLGLNLNTSLIFKKEAVPIYILSHWHLTMYSLLHEEMIYEDEISVVKIDIAFDIVK